MDGIVRRRTATPNITMKEMIPNGFNSKREASNNQNDYGAIDMKVMIPGGWNSQRDVSNVYHNPAFLKVPWRRKG